MSQCEVENCTKKIVAYGLCDMHRKRLSRHGHLKQTRPKNWGKKHIHPLWNTFKWMNTMQAKYSIDPQWKDFWKFVECVGERPSPQHQLRRLDLHEGYGPKNFQWAETIPDQDRAEYAKKWRKDNPDKCRNTYLRKHYGITLEDYNRMYKEQNGVCAICGQEEPLSSSSLAVDHDHETKKIRGLLCSKCNQGLGCFKDSQEILNKAFNYLTIQPYWRGETPAGELTLTGRKGKIK